VALPCQGLSGRLTAWRPAPGGFARHQIEPITGVDQPRPDGSSSRRDEPCPANQWRAAL